MVQTNDVLLDLYHRLWQLRDREKIRYETTELLKRAAKKNGEFQSAKPVTSILNAIGETNWIYNRKTTRLLTDLINEIEKEMNRDED
ncbi:hypothetical protein FC35_GL001851 [Limosilactobacillus coleohominis DSM 14060]|nr:hypothetical protein FC35_GL001851 [Limosilactobacillus coleohominis DSM 14060]